ncbi:MAG: putative tRNA dimethylallyltransferase [Candidatus Saccharibacteria bacterium]|nr:putative tRNA dimethylallyltransferase [Candidatus Saccharibacteria bacterium]
MATPIEYSSQHHGETTEAPLVVIVGPTASGKSALAMELAKVFNGEIICADSRTVYKNMDIGTTKPSAADQAAVPHWGLDLVEPGEVFTAADFKNYALSKAQQIRERGHVPFIVGGTGLYVDGVIFDYEFGQPQPELRKQLEALSLEELKTYCANNNISLPENENNRRYVIRAIEQKSINSKRLRSPINNIVLVGITTDRIELRRRIATRAEQLFENGMLEEAIKLGEKYGWDNEAMTGNIYKLARKYVDGQLMLDEIKQANATADWRLAKRQLTWLKRNPYINWFTLSDAHEYIKAALKS